MKRFLITVAAIALGGAGAYAIVLAVSLISPFTVVNADAVAETHYPSAILRLLLDIPQEPITRINYSDFVSIMLTGVSLILAALGFVMALLAFIGWNSIGDRVSSLAKTFLKDAMEEGGELHNLVKEEAKSIIYRGVEPVDTQYDEGAREEETL
ncbi:hypothetical protein [Pseudogemmobacter sp. W21_MBD1_M6]|uniref:hypothetical protein n=1 Tax=Pseudogemmobacter sp. W21_MBD1_M6 TaxID=3240271 RepID=UPI003F974F1B